MAPKILVLDRSEELAEQARGALGEMDSPPEIVSCTRIGSVGHVQEHDGPFAVLLAGPSLATRAGLRRLAALRRESPATAIIVAFATRPEATLREIVQVGAVDLLELPAEDVVLRAVIKRALDLHEQMLAAAEPVVASVVQHPATSHRAGRVFTVCSATGGCGKTFYAANMALFLARTSSARVALVDLDLQFGETMTALRLQPPYTIVDALSHEGDDDRPDLSEHIEDYLVRYDGTFWTLAAPKEPSQADEVTPIEVTKVIEALRSRFDYVIVDTPTALAETVLAAFDLSEHLFVMATLDLPSVRNLGMFLQTLQKLRIPTDNVSLVLNKIESDVGIEVAQIVKLFPQGFRSTLPYAKEVSRSINLGKPVVASYPQAEISKKLVAGLRPFLPEGDRIQIDLTEAVAAPGPLGRLFKRHAVARGEAGR
jgi:pilus assembly protein CpaE